MHDQTRYPLATLVLVASERAPAQKIRILALASRVSREREQIGIPSVNR